MYSGNILLGPVVWLMLLLQMNVWLERFAGEPSQEDGVGHPQLEEGTSRMQALELELAEAREAKKRSEGEVRRLKEELERK